MHRSKKIDLNNQTGIGLRLMVASSAACRKHARMLLECTFSLEPLTLLLLGSSNFSSTRQSPGVLWFFLWPAAILSNRKLGVNHAWDHPLSSFILLYPTGHQAFISNFPNKSNICHLLITSLNMTWTTNLSPCFHPILYIASYFFA